MRFCTRLYLCSHSGEIAPLVGATPVFVDVLPDTFNMDPASLEAGIETAKAEGPHAKMVIPVDLFGQPAVLPHQRNRRTTRHGGYGRCRARTRWFAQRRQGRAWRPGPASFFPAKPLGCYGDGGAVMTDDDDRAAL